MVVSILFRKHGRFRTGSGFDISGERVSLLLAQNVQRLSLKYDCMLQWYNEIGHAIFSVLSWY